jgi:hypothetical protein
VVLFNQAYCNTKVLFIKDRCHLFYQTNRTVFYTAMTDVAREKNPVDIYIFIFYDYQSRRNNVIRPRDNIFFFFVTTVLTHFLLFKKERTNCKIVLTFSIEWRNHGKVVCKNTARKTIFICLTIELDDNQDHHMKLNFR